MIKLLEIILRGKMIMKKIIEINWKLDEKEKIKTIRK
jgi:hypothetical protein